MDNFSKVPERKRFIPRWLTWTLVIGVSAVALFFLVREIFFKEDTPIRLNIYAFSTQEEALSQGVIPAFEKSWEEKTGKELEIETVFGPSVILASQINLGAPADIALFSNVHQVNWLKIGKKVRADAHPDIYGFTPIVFVTRPGNPGNISNYQSLAQPGIQIIHADPRSSGVGEWAILAEYGSALFTSGDPLVAKDQLVDIWRNVKVLAPSARAALTLFELGAGDVIITYEQDALLARDRGVDLEMILPEYTVLAEHYAVVVDDNVTSREQAVVDAFMAYLLGDGGQAILNQFHTRPVSESSIELPELVSPFRVDDLGGWTQAHHDLIDMIWQEEIAPDLNLEQTPMHLDSGE